jgi:hypothetical protein
MSAQIKNKLIRFAELRIPGLVTPKIKTGYHIRHPDSS